MTQKISLCMITRNEEVCLEKCLNSVKEISDEIIIVDTGSTDKTKEICKKFNFKEKIKFFDYEWADDFSAARNESLKHASKDWILVMDADEVIDKDDLNKIKEIIKDNENDGFLFLQKNYTNDVSVAGFVNEEHKNKDTKYAGWYGSLIVRLFKNKKEYSFEGTVHELVENSIVSKNGKIALANITLHHYGNTEAGAVKKKRKFYLELCKKKVEKNKDPKSYYELGILYKENNLPEEAKQSFEKAVELNPKYSMALFELGVVAEQQNNYDNSIKYYKESLRITENSDSFQNLGVCYLKKGNLEDAYANLTKAMLLNPNNYTIYNSIGAVLEKSGNYDMAVQMLEIAIKLNPKNTIGFYNLGIALDKKGDFENAAKSYEKAIELGHNKKEDIKKRINELKSYAKNDKLNYSFGAGC